MAYPLTLNPITAANVVIAQPTQRKLATVTLARNPDTPPWQLTPRTAAVFLFYSTPGPHIIATRTWGGQMSAGPIVITPPSPTTGQIWPRGKK